MQIYLSSPSYGNITLGPTEKEGQYKVKQNIQLSLFQKIEAAFKAALLYLKLLFKNDSHTKEKLHFELSILKGLSSFEAKIDSNFTSTFQVVFGRLHNPQKIAQDLAKIKLTTKISYEKSNPLITETPVEVVPEVRQNEPEIPKDPEPRIENPVESLLPPPEHVVLPPEILQMKPEPKINIDNIIDILRKSELEYRIFEFFDGKHPLQNFGIFYFQVKKYFQMDKKEFKRFHKKNLEELAKQAKSCYELKQYAKKLKEFKYLLLSLVHSNEKFQEVVQFIEDREKQFSLKEIEEQEKRFALYLLKNNKKHVHIYRYLPYKLQLDPDIIVYALKSEINLDYFPIQFFNDRNFVLSAVVDCPKIYDLSHPKISEDEEIILTRCENDNYFKLPKIFQNNKSFILKAIESGYNRLCVSNFSDDPDIIKAAVKKSLHIFYNLKPEQKEDRGFVLAAATNKKFTIEYLPKKFGKDKDIILTIIRNNPHEYLKCEMRNDIDVVLAFLNSGKGIWIYIPNQFKTRREVVFAALNSNEFNTDFNNDREYVLKALQKNGLFLEKVSNTFKQDETFVLEAIKNNPNALQYADEKLLADDNFMMKAAKLIGAFYILVYANPKFRDNEELVRQAIGEHPLGFRLASPALKKNAELARFAVKCYLRNYDEVDPSMKDDPLIQQELQNYNNKADAISDLLLQKLIPPSGPRQIIAEYLLDPNNPLLVKSGDREYSLDSSSLNSLLYSLYLLLPDKEALRRQFISRVGSFSYDTIRSGYLRIRKPDNPTYANLMDKLDSNSHKPIRIEKVMRKCLTITTQTSTDI